MPSKHESGDIFNTVVRDSSLWEEQSRSLRKSADVLLDKLSKATDSYDRIAYMQSFMLLIGFAFENVIEALLVKTHPDVIKINSGRVHVQKEGKDIGGHELNKLIEKVMMLDDKEKELLNRLETFILWGGRYPAPLSPR